MSFVDIWLPFWWSLLSSLFSLLSLLLDPGKCKPCCSTVAFQLFIISTKVFPLLFALFPHLISQAFICAKYSYEYANLGRCKPCCSCSLCSSFSALFPLLSSNLLYLMHLFFLFSPPIHSILCNYHKNGRIAAAVTGTKTGAAAVEESKS